MSKFSFLIVLSLLTQNLFAIDALDILSAPQEERRLTANGDFPDNLEEPVVRQGTYGGGSYGQSTRTSVRGAFGTTNQMNRIAEELETFGKEYSSSFERDPREDIFGCDREERRFLLSNGLRKLVEENSRAQEAGEAFRDEADIEAYKRLVDYEQRGLTIDQGAFEETKHIMTFLLEGIYSDWAAVSKFPISRILNITDRHYIEPASVTGNVRLEHLLRLETQRLLVNDRVIDAVNPASLIALDDFILIALPDYENNSREGRRARKALIASAIRSFNPEGSDPRLVELYNQLRPSVDILHRERRSQLREISRGRPATVRNNQSQRQTAFDSFTSYEALISYMTRGSGYLYPVPWAIDDGYSWGATKVNLELPVSRTWRTNGVARVKIAVGGAPVGLSATGTFQTDATVTYTRTFTTTAVLTSARGNTPILRNGELFYVEGAPIFFQCKIEARTAFDRGLMGTIGFSVDYRVPGFAASGSTELSHGVTDTSTYVATRMSPLVLVPHEVGGEVVRKEDIVRLCRDLYPRQAIPGECGESIQNDTFLERLLSQAEEETYLVPGKTIRCRRHNDCRGSNDFDIRALNAADRRGYCEIDESQGLICKSRGLRNALCLTKPFSRDTHGLRFMYTNCREGLSCQNSNSDGVGRCR